MAKGPLWTGAEEIRFRKAVEAGLSRAELCQLLDRTDESLRKKARRLGLVLPPAERKHSTFNYEDRVFEQPKKAIERSTKQLGEAINSLLSRMPDRVVRSILCPPAKPEPGTERIYKTASIERLAA